MVDKPTEDILVNPAWPILMDGNGYNFQLVGSYPFIDGAGRKSVRLKLRCDELTRKRYDLKQNDELDRNMQYTLVALEKDLIHINQYDAANNKWLYVKSIKGEETEMSQREKNLKDELQQLEDVRLRQEAEILKLSEELNLAQTNALKWVSQSAEAAKNFVGIFPTNQIQNPQNPGGK